MQTTAFKFFVQFIQHDIGQEWAKRASLRSAFLAHLEHAMIDYAAAQILVYERDDSSVLDGTGKNLYQLAVTHCIKETLQIKVDYVNIAFRDNGLRFPQCLVAAALRTEAEAVVAELTLIDGSQDLVDGLLHYSVYHCRYAKQALLAIFLGYLYPSDGIRTVASVHKGAYQFILVGA